MNVFFQKSFGRVKRKKGTGEEGGPNGHENRGLLIRASGEGNQK